MQPRKERLDLAIAQAKQGIQSLDPASDSAGNKVKARSKLNRLRGVSQVEDTRDSKLLEKVGTSRRPTFDLVADQVLGKESRNPARLIEFNENNGQSLSDIAAQRIKDLRERTLAQINQKQMEAQP